MAVVPLISVELLTVKAPAESMLTLPPVDLAATVTALASVTCWSPTDSIDKVATSVLMRLVDVPMLPPALMRSSDALMVPSEATAAASRKTAPAAFRFTLAAVMFFFRVRSPALVVIETSPVAVTPDINPTSPTASAVLLV